MLAWPVGALSLRYQEPASGQWSEAWPPPGMAVSALPPSLLPAAVELRLEGPAPAWPPLMVALRASYATDPSAVMGGFGGSGR